MNYPRTISNLIECFKKFPGIGEKTAERLALETLKLDDEIIELFSKSVKDVKEKTKKCKKCGSLSEEELCEICQNVNRNHKIICIVEDSKNVIQFEKIGVFKGVYHVLGGLISPLEGINPEDLSIKSLINRINEENPEEIILAIKPSIEGETTSLYIRKLLEGVNIKISKIAYGIPIGADIDYIDPMTLEIALEDRTTIS